MNTFANARELPPDPIFGLVSTFNQDPRKEKVDLMVGVYRDASLECSSLSVVTQTIQELAKEKRDPNYLPFMGTDEYRHSTARLMFGREKFQELESRLVISQGVGGTGTLYMGGRFLKSLGCKRVFVSDPTWANHQQIFAGVGFEVCRYPYYDINQGEFLFDQMIEALEMLEEGDVVILHTCCHNPSGFDPSSEEWSVISEVIKRRKAIPFFDTAYQGFKEDPISDVSPVLQFIEDGHTLLSTQSFSKNFTLYSERVSTLYVYTATPEEKMRVESGVKLVARSSYSNPPRFGAAVVSRILNDSVLQERWLKELGEARDRIKGMRNQLISALNEQIPSKNWDRLTKAAGLFSFLGLSRDQVLKMRDEHGIYMTGSGRINVTGLSDANLPYVIDSLKSVLGTA